jgi:hypothetical protein
MVAPGRGKKLDANRGERMHGEACVSSLAPFLFPVSAVNGKLFFFCRVGGKRIAICVLELRACISIPYKINLFSSSNHCIRHP